MLRNHKQIVKPQATDPQAASASAPGPPANNPIAAAATNPINSNAANHAAMTQFLMQGPPMPGSVAQYPTGMHHYGMPGSGYLYVVFKSPVRSGFMANLA